MDEHRDNEALRQAVLCGIARDRTPGLSFTGHFLDVAWPRVGKDGATVTLSPRPQCIDERGDIELTALLMALDNALATPTRLFIRPGERIATAHLHAQFTGAPISGQLAIDATFEGLTAGDAAGQLLARGSVVAGDTALCHGSGAFVRLPPPPGARDMAPLPWQVAAQPAPPPLRESDLDARERTILAACDAVLAAGAAGAAGRVSFLRRFWDILPAAVQGGAYCRTVTGPHMANRVGHVQGGILLGIAAETARVAVPRHSVFSNISAWFLSPGRDAHLECRASIVHEGRSFAVIRSEITGAGGVRVFEAMTAHAAPHRHAEVERMAPVVKTPDARAD